MIVPYLSDLLVDLGLCSLQSYLYLYLSSDRDPEVLWKDLRYMVRSEGGGRTPVRES